MSIMSILYGAKSAIDSWVQYDIAVHVPTPASGVYSSASFTGPNQTISGISSPENLTMTSLLDDIIAGSTGQLVIIKNGIDFASINLAIANASINFTVETGDTLAFRLDATHTVPASAHWTFASTLILQSHITLYGGGLNLIFDATITADINP